MLHSVQVEKLDAIILAGGLGTRLREVVHDLPKVLAPVSNRPFLDINMGFLNKWSRIQKVVIAVGYMADKIIKEYTDRHEYHFEIFFSEEKELLGTGGAIKKALRYTETKNILALNGDSFVDVNIEDLVRTHRGKKASMTVVLKEVGNTVRYGKVNINDEQRITSFEEKKPEQGSGYINAGVYIFNRELFGNIKENKIISLEKELLPIFLGKAVYGYICHGKFIDIGIPETYEKASTYLRENF